MTTTYTIDTTGVDTERVRLLVQALRSGQFRQGRESLAQSASSGDMFCCLGVACEVAMQHGLPLGRFLDEAESRYYYYHDRYRDDMGLPEPVSDWYGFREGSGNNVANWWVKTPEGLGEVVCNVATHNHGDRNWVSLATLNDCFQLTFEQIADAIEATYLTGGAS